MSTLAIILVATFLCISIGIPLGMQWPEAISSDASCSNFRVYANYT